MSNKTENEGEGNRTADENYRKGVRETVEKTDEEERAERARDVGDEEKSELRKAERAAEDRAKE